jgi:3-hydroxyisobutyrate dehydrogenase-like beta-hydroxyacid dehydrogenase
MNKREQASVQLATLGFIGLGHMGSHMAGKLLAAGYPVTIYDRTKDNAQALVPQGATVADAPKDVAARSEVVLVSVTDDEAQEQVMFSPAGVLAGLRDGSIIIDLSTVSPRASRRLYQAAREHRAAMIDAAVSGSVAQVDQGSLAIFVGGDQETYQQCRPILDVLGHSFYMGASGSGTTMKLVANTLTGVGMQALAEAIALGEKAGLSKESLLDVLEQTAVLTGGQKAKLANVKTEQYPVQFALSLMHKDFGLILTEAAEVGVPMPATAAAQQMSTAALAKEGDEDFSVMVHFMQALAGVGRT